VTAELPIIEFAFPGPLRDRIVAAIEAGAKTATSSLLREYEAAGEPVPQVGFRGVVVDSAGRRGVVLETTAVELVRLCDVPLQHALDEGRATRQSTNGVQAIFASGLPQRCRRSWATTSRSTIRASSCSSASRS
jgi:hypothetical protein